MTHDVIVLGAGMVGVSTAIHLVRRGRSVLLVDRREPGQETSFGNAGIIQREGVRPHPFPRDLATLAQVGLHLSTAARYDPLSLPRFAPALARYWWKSSPASYQKVVRSYAPLIAQSIDAHADLIAAAGVEDLIVKNGWYLAFRTEKALKAETRKAQADHDAYGIHHKVVDGDMMARIEPGLKTRLAGALHWTDPWTVRDPGALVSAYARLYSELGGAVATAEIKGLTQDSTGWSVETGEGSHQGREVVIALGPWAPEILDPLGYRLPLFVKRGYHMHYEQPATHPLNNWVLDAEIGYLLAPMHKGIRLTTGAEFAPRDAAATPIQLGRAERAARGLIDLGARLDPQPWKGARPCTPDMMPIIGAAPKHRGLWVAIGHAHHGFTLGPATGRVLAEAMTGEKPVIDIAPFAMERFGGTYPD
ncbi:NAD(P)/FAD-dependent oxidoreductase [Pelagibacterium xiamenense]|uniref:NAD(P)/FAD-dependent oxidoreductase n=1 Tax=Pelagibacterium xiamenense TaxID=2901140 RepID=UPI001E3CFC6E|nr:FAD-binding oxidoreductase [Pelagibacterium xiamenense]MCD7059622.1 FAD-binding oxidoreductase [Pelagibacterium xiamenense]